MPRRQARAVRLRALRRSASMAARSATRRTVPRTRACCAGRSSSPCVCECHNGLDDFGRTGTGIPLTPPSHNMLQARFQNCTTCHVRIHGSNADPILPPMTAMKPRPDALASVAAALAAQTDRRSHRPSHRSVRPRGENVGGLQHSEFLRGGIPLRLGGRRRLDKYRSDVNYGNGVRLLLESLAVHSQDGHGRFFDELTARHAGTRQRSVRVRFLARAEEPPLPIQPHLARRRLLQSRSHHRLRLSPRSTPRRFLQDQTLVTCPTDRDSASSPATAATPRAARP